MTFKKLTPLKVMSVSRTFLVSSPAVTTAARGVDVSLRNVAMVANLRTLFSSVKIAEVAVSLVTFMNDDVELVFGLVPSTLSMPTVVGAVYEVPHQNLVVSNSTTAIVHTAVFSQATTPGLEWDMAQTAIAGGHPVFRIMHASDLAEGEDVKVVARATVLVTVTCDGTAFGA